jgi:multidrug efflux pump
MDVNIFVQVGFVVLVGLACKNASLIVEFARDRQQARASRFDAALEAARVRLRPIVMTSFAFILGVLLLVVAQRAGAEMRRTLGTAAFAGMIGVTLFGLFLTPVFYSVVRWFSDGRPVNCAPGSDRAATGLVLDTVEAGTVADSHTRTDLRRIHRQTSA